MLNEVMYKFAELLDKLPEVQETPQDIELLPNRVAELTVEGPITFTENVFYSAATDESMKILQEKKHPMPDSNIIEKAHPKSIYVANSRGGQGGLVENQNEQQERIVQIINRRPTGQHWNTYASFVQDLVKVATKLENTGRKDLANEVDQLLHLITN